MKQYLDLLQHILKHGEKRQDRTKTGTLAVFGYQMRFDLQEGFPLLTTKKLHVPSIIHELLWFLKGDSNIDYLHAHNVHIWDAWADEQGHLGNLYGSQWRKWQGADHAIDQIAQVIGSIQSNPHSRRHIVSAWKVDELNTMRLLPCHVLFQFYVHSDQTLSCQLYQRSADSFLGLPFNIASYALLTMMIASLCHLKPGYFIHTLGDAHLYLNHINQAQEQLKRRPRRWPTMTIAPKPHIDAFEYTDFTLHDYNPHPHIKGDVSV